MQSFITRLTKKWLWWRVDRQYRRSKKKSESSKAILETMGVVRPVELPGVLVVEGDPQHKHAFMLVSWESHLGSDFIKHDGHTGTYRDLHRCSCGREVITSTRAMV